MDFWREIRYHSFVKFGDAVTYLQVSEKTYDLRFSAPSTRAETSLNTTLLDQQYYFSSLMFTFEHTYGSHDISSLLISDVIVESVPRIF